MPLNRHRNQPQIEVSCGCQGQSSRGGHRSKVETVDVGDRCQSLSSRAPINLPLAQKTGARIVSGMVNRRISAKNQGGASSRPSPRCWRGSSFQKKKKKRREVLRLGTSFRFVKRDINGKNNVGSPPILTQAHMVVEDLVLHRGERWNNPLCTHN